MRKNIINLKKSEIKNFFFKSDSYFKEDLPEYFNFEKFIKQVDKFQNGFDISKAGNNNTSYVIYHNKDGKYAWRKFQLIHPIVYIKLVDIIAENWDFIQDHFKKNKTSNISYCPIYKKNVKHKKQKKTQILAYLEDIEKESIKKSLDFKYLTKLDIADCYSSVYTHSVGWALHTKSVAKINRKNSFLKKAKKTDKILFGNDIDFLLRSMQSGQTNGIPQGSVLMDFIAEIILVYIDKLLDDKLINEEITDYKIIRYRDDYRIFTKEKNENEKIVKTLSEVLIDFNFKLNTNKTEVGEDVVLMSIKKDKLENIMYDIGDAKGVNVYKLKRFLLDILKISKTYPNSGFILKILQHFNQRDFYKKNKNWYKKEVQLILIILLEIVVSNPRCFSVVCISLFNLLPKLDKSQYEYYVNIIYKKLIGINNIGYNEIWLQRSLYKINKNKRYKDRVCSVVLKMEKESIFGNHFISDKKLKNLLDKNNFIDRKKLLDLSKIPKNNEVNIFTNSELI